jgi:transposase
MARDDTNRPAPQEPGESITQIRLKARRERVKSLLARHLTATEIAKALDVSVRTIETDVRAVRAELSAELASKSTLEWGGTVWRGYVARQRELWLLFQKEEKNTAAKVQILKEMRNSDRDVVAALQSLGISYRAPEQMQVDMRVLAQLRSLEGDVLEKISNAQDSSELREILVQNLGPEVVKEVLKLSAGSTPFGDIEPGIPGTVNDLFQQGGER